MTVAELQKVLATQPPDAEVRIGAKWRDADNKIVFGATVSTDEAYFLFDDVLIEGMEAE